MVKSGARALLTILLVVTMAGTAVALAVGVNFSPHNTVCVHPIPGSSYQICINVPPQNVRNVQVNGLNLGALKKGHLDLKLTNNNKVPVTINLLLVIKTKSGKIRRTTETVVLQPGKTFTLNKSLKGLKIRGGKLTLTVSDTSGDHTTITKTIGKFG